MGLFHFTRIFATKLIIIIIIVAVAAAVAITIKTIMITTRHTIFRLVASSQKKVNSLSLKRPMHHALMSPL